MNSVHSSREADSAEEPPSTPQRAVSAKSGDSVAQGDADSGQNRPYGCQANPRASPQSIALQSIALQRHLGSPVVGNRAAHAPTRVEVALVENRSVSVRVRRERAHPAPRTVLHGLGSQKLSFLQFRRFFFALARAKISQPRRKRAIGFPVVVLHSIAAMANTAPVYTRPLRSVAPSLLQPPPRAGARR